MNFIDKPTLVVGASPKSVRYSNMAVERLLHYGYTVYALAKRRNTIYGIEIEPSPVELNDVHTVTMYLGATHQKDLYDYIIGLNPKRIIFNPGAENTEFETLAREQNIDMLRACTLVMLSTNQY